MRKAKFKLHFFCLSLALATGWTVFGLSPVSAQFYPNSGGSHYPGSPLYGTSNSSQYYPGTNYPIYGSPLYSYYYYGNRQGKVSSLVESRTNQQIKKATTWEAPTKEDNKVELEIENTQVDYGIDSKEAIELIWKRAKQYNDSHQYEKALKLLDQLEPLLRKKDKSLLIPGNEMYKMRADINVKMGNYAGFRLTRSGYNSGGGKNSPVSLDNFTFNDPRFNPYYNLSIPYGSSKNSTQSKRNYYP